MELITFATAINCMDGRVQIPVIEYIKQNYRVDYVDMITEPGPNKILADNDDKTVLTSIKKRVLISLDRHKSRLIFLAGHHDCAGNPADKETQLTQIISSVNTIKFWNLDAKVLGLWVDENWRVCDVI
ncbi:hypothetical protein H8E88_24070 [candidate division KSB1 bacterium]|nr:hypothetical protein [candidate division KSB1 bacterium]